MYCPDITECLLKIIQISKICTNRDADYLISFHNESWQCFNCYGVITFSHIQQLCSKRLSKHIIKHIYKWRDTYSIDLKTLWQKEKMLNMNNFSSRHNDSKCRLADLAESVRMLVRVDAAFERLFVFPGFSAPALHATGCHSTYTVSPLVKDEGPLSQLLLSNVEENFGWAGIQTHNPW